MINVITEWSRINKTLEAASKASQTVPVDDTPPRRIPSPHVAAPPVPLPPPQEPSTSIRPTIKLKHPSSTQKPVEASAPVAKLKIRKPKPIVDAPPPPYVDDGSHDILQEVIAIEKEKGIRLPEKDRVVEKRKRPSPEEDDDDDILALAAPISSKKKNSNQPTPSVIGARENGVAPSRNNTPSTQPPVRISVKGKEKEVPPAPSSSIPKLKKLPSAQMTPINDKKCKDVLKALLKLPEAGIFARPVDPILDGCPT